MQLLSNLNQRVARSTIALTLVLLLGLASVAMANSGNPGVLPVEPDGGIGGEVVLPVEPDGGIGGEIAEDLPLPVEPDGGIGN